MPQKPLVGVFTKQLDNWTSGSGHHLNEMMKHILQMNTKLRFAFIHYKKSDNPIYQLADEEIIIPRNPFKASRILAKKEFDVIHYTPLTFFAPIWGIKAKKTATIHGVEQLLVPQFYGPLEMAHERLLVPVYARKMDHIITVSQASKNFFIKHYRVKPERITVCPNAVGDHYHQKDPQDILFNVPYKTVSGQSFNPDEKFIFHISRFSERKNPWTVLEGFSHFSQSASGKDFFLVIAGGKWNHKAVLEKIEMLGISDKVVLTGFVDEETAVNLYNKAFIFLFPSLAEGFGMPNIEAMACGCPVITSQIFAIPEVVGEAALIMQNPRNIDDLSTMLKSLADDPQKRREMIHKGLEHAKKYRSWENSARDMLKVFENLS